jgi:hypothetical protein
MYVIWIFFQIHQGASLALLSVLQAWFCHYLLIGDAGRTLPKITPILLAIVCTGMNLEVSPIPPLIHSSLRPCDCN